MWKLCSFLSFLSFHLTLFFITFPAHDHFPGPRSTRISPVSDYKLLKKKKKKKEKKKKAKKANQKQNYVFLVDSMLTLKRKDL